MCLGQRYKQQGKCCWQWASNHPPTPRKVMRTQAGSPVHLCMSSQHHVSEKKQRTQTRLAAPALPTLSCTCQLSPLHIPALSTWANTSGPRPFRGLCLLFILPGVFFSWRETGTTTISILQKRVWTPREISCLGGERPYCRLRFSVKTRLSLKPFPLPGGTMTSSYTSLCST